MERITVFLADDNLIAREGVRAVLALEDDIEVVGTAADYDELVAGAERLAPLAIVTDIRMPPNFEREGIDAAKEIRKRHPGTGVVVLSQYDDPHYAVSLLSDGAARFAYLLKDRIAEGDQLARAMREVTTGGSMLDPRIVGGLVTPVRDDSLSPGKRRYCGRSPKGATSVAVAFQPVRVRVQRLANRLVYGRRASPYEALAAISEQAAAARAAEDVLPRVARAVAEGTGAAHARVWVASTRELRLVASWPDAPAATARTVTLDDAGLPQLSGVDAAVPVRHRGELLGALSVVKPRGESLRAADEQLLGDVAAHAGLVLRNVGLTAELLARLEELRASRQRLVSAQDEERRRLERNLHDGAQQHLVGLKVKLTLATRQAEDARLQQALDGLQNDVDEAIEALRDLARGIYPPLLAREGLAAALDAHARKASLPAGVEADGVGRYAQDVEAAVYFCCLEALQNVAKYAGTSRAVIRLDEAEGELRFTVRDDGAGFDSATTGRGSGLQNMADRTAALGGQLDVVSTPGGGTVVTGRIPVVDATSVARGRPAAGEEEDGSVPGSREPELREAGTR